MEKLALQTHITPNSISVNNLVLTLPDTELRPSDISLNFNGFGNIAESLKTGEHRIIFLDNKVSPSDFGWLVPALRRVPGEMAFTLEAEGNLNNLSLNRLDLSDRRDFSIRFSADAESFLKPDKMNLDNVALDLHLGERSAVDLLALLPDNLRKVRNIVAGMAPISLTLSGKGDMSEKKAEGKILLDSGCGSLKVDGSASHISKMGADIKGDVEASDLNIGRIIDNTLVGNLTAEINIYGRVRGKDSEGKVTAMVNDFSYKGIPLGGMEVEMEKVGKDMHTVLTADNILSSIDASADLILDGRDSRILLNADIDSFNPSLMGWLPKYNNYILE
ncbi:MAG: hypothetical protein K2H15_02560, partial [Muribaculaceae bacterium]|nr:hypothetical protein [Muribaculaceae bacterium]